MPQLRFVRNLKTNNANMFDLLVSFVFRRVNLDIYRPQNTYYENNTIIMLNATTGKFEVKRCIATSTTGAYNAADWVTDSVQESANSQFIDTYTQLSTTQPSNTLNRIWLHQVKTRGQIDPDTFLS